MMQATNQHSEESNRVGEPEENFDSLPAGALVKKNRKRLLVQKGLENLVLRIDEIILFYTENKVVYVIDKYEKKYLADSSLAELEAGLDERYFFRANRQYLINIDYIRSFRPFEKVKIRIDMNLHTLEHLIIVSQETAPAFRKWVYEA